MAVKILLADDHKIVRDGLRSLIEKQPNMQVVGEACDGRTTVSSVRELMPNVVIIDIGMPDLNGIEATRQITQDNPNIKVIALSMHSDRRFVLRMLEAGASGYLLKDSAFDELSLAISTVVAGKIYLSPAIAGIVVEDFVRHSPSNVAGPVSIDLTPREREVLQLLAEGKSTKQIASHLNVSVKTVETHRRQVMEKLDIHSVAELTKYAVREGLTSLEM
ncbi:MAG: DNA-binding response regulator [Planctomycetes bacterium GWF2_50_10]|nr:MAG: DNA-binding response regulator [Planctomycetes bacterium GWF2_50_10]